VLFVVVGVACGGGGGDETPTPTAPATVEPTNTARPGGVSGSPTAEDEPATPTALPAGAEAPDPQTLSLERFEVPAGSRPHDVAPAPDGGVWFTAQGSGHLGWLDPDTGETRMVDLGPASAPHGVIEGPDGAAWITDSGQNAIVRVAWPEGTVRRFPLPPNRARANLNTATFDGEGVLWFTGQSGIYGSFDPAIETMNVYDAPGGRGPYGIATDPDGGVWMASLAGGYLGRIDVASGEMEVIEPPTPTGIRRVWADSAGMIWMSEWDAGAVGRYDPATGEWQEWTLPGSNPMAYSVWVDEHDRPWLTDFGADTVVLFDPGTEEFHSFELPGTPGNVRQMLGRPGEAWGAESATDHLVVVR
jgi:virginiamycin B lyase